MIHFSCFIAVFTDGDQDSFWQMPVILSIYVTVMRTEVNPKNIQFFHVFNHSSIDLIHLYSLQVQLCSMNFSKKKQTKENWHHDVTNLNDIIVAMTVVGLIQPFIRSLLLTNELNSFHSQYDSPCSRITGSIGFPFSQLAC